MVFCLLVQSKDIQQWIELLHSIIFIGEIRISIDSSGSSELSGTTQLAARKTFCFHNDLFKRQHSIGAVAVWLRL